MCINLIHGKTWIAGLLPRYFLQPLPIAVFIAAPEPYKSCVVFTYSFRLGHFAPTLRTQLVVLRPYNYWQQPGIVFIFHNRHPHYSMRLQILRILPVEPYYVGDSTRALIGKAIGILPNCGIVIAHYCKRG